MTSLHKHYSSHTLTVTSCSCCDVTSTLWPQTASPTAGSSCTWCRTPCRTRSSLQERKQLNILSISGGHRGRECVASLTSDQRTHSLIQISAGDIIKYQLMELYSKTLFSLLVKQNQKHIYWCHFNQWATNFIFFSLMIIFRILLKFVKSVSTWALLINDWDISCWCYRWSKEPKLYLRCSRVTAGRGGTTATADTASLRLSRCSGAAALSGTVGAGPGLGPGDPEGSTGPECGEGGVSLNCSVLNRAESAEIHRLTPERTFSESLWSTTSNSPLSRWR